jgi:hypothetical protein
MVANSSDERVPDNECYYESVGRPFGLPRASARLCARGASVNILKDRARVLRPRAWKRPGAPPKVRQAVFEDYDQIAAVQLRNGLIYTKSREDWVALWRGNPVYEACAGQWPIGWVLEAENGEIVGSIGNLPLVYQFRGRELRVGSPIGWAVDPQYRGYSLLILDQFLKQKEVDLFICTTVGPQAEPVFSAVGLSRVPVGQWHKSTFWITNYRRFSGAVLSQKSALLAAVMSHPMSVALYCWDKLHDLRMRGGSSIVEIELCSGFDRRFDDFWEELRRQNDDVLLAVRTPQTLQWHFRNTPQRPATWILGVLERSRLTAYAIFDRSDSAVGLKRVRLVDFQALCGSEEALGATLQWMLNRCRKEGIPFLEVTGCWLNRPSLPRVVAPYHRNLPCWAYYYKAKEKHLSEALQDSAAWAPSSFDGDASL